MPCRSGEAAPFPRQKYCRTIFYSSASARLSPDQHQSRPLYATHLDITQLHQITSSHLRQLTVELTQRINTRICYTMVLDAKPEAMTLTLRNRSINQNMYSKKTNQIRIQQESWLDLKKGLIQRETIRPFRSALPTDRSRDPCA